MSYLQKCVLYLPLWLCCQAGLGQTLPLTIGSDSTLAYYYEGWRQVLDIGHFSHSEKAYRRMYELDPGFLVGASLLARITPDPTERQELLDYIVTREDQVDGDEARLLSLFLNLTRLYIYRENGQAQLATKNRQRTMLEGEETLGYLARKYPDDLYYHCEYIEFVHANQGPAKALQLLDEGFESPPPFMIGYKAQLLAELQETANAFEIAANLEELIGPEAPYLHMVYAKIYLEKGDEEEALNRVNQALRIDPGHILALRMKGQLTEP